MHRKSRNCTTDVAFLVDYRGEISNLYITAGAEHLNGPDQCHQFREIPMKVGTRVGITCIRGNHFILS